MKFGTALFIGAEGTAVHPGFVEPKDIVQIAKTADKLGYDSIWTRDHLTTSTQIRSANTPQRPNFYEVLISLSYCAAVTEQIQLGLGVIVMPFRDPILLAKQLATLDVFSGGRVLFGVGLGSSREEFEMLYPRQRRIHRANMMEEQLEAMNLLFTEPVASFKGKYFEFNDVVMDPKPLQRPFPVLVSGNAPDTIERAVKYGTGLMVYASTLEVLKQSTEKLHALAVKHGRDPSEIDILTNMSLSIASTHEEAIKRVEHSATGRRTGADVDINAILSRSLVGTPEEITEKTKQREAVGLKHCMITSLAGDTLEEKMEQMQMFGEEVLPRVK